MRNFIYCFVETNVLIIWICSRWVNNGGMFIAHNAVRLDEYKRLFTIGRHGKYGTTLASSRNFLQMILHCIQYANTVAISGRLVSRATC